MNALGWWMALGCLCALDLAACRTDTSPGDTCANCCVETCAMALTVGGVPCAADAPGLNAYQDLNACVEASDAGVASTCAGLLANQGADSACMTALSQQCPSELMTCQTPPTQ